jgi:predicted metallopeptidase
VPEARAVEEVLKLEPVAVLEMLEVMVVHHQFQKDMLEDLVKVVLLIMLAEVAVPVKWVTQTDKDTEETA